MKVDLIAKTILTEAGQAIASSGREDQGQGSEAEKLTEIGGRNCYDSWATGRTSEEYHKHILEVGHGSVLQHANWTFEITGISRNLSLELIRHHIGTAVSQRSTRYVDEGETPTILHPLTKKVLETPDLYDDEVVAASMLKRLIAEADEAARKVYNFGVPFLQHFQAARGVTKFAARKQARGAMARHLPSGLDTSIVWTMNARAARNVIEQRLNEAADAEIRELGQHFLNILVKDSPELFSDYVTVPSNDGLAPGCTTPYRKV